MGLFMQQYGNVINNIGSPPPRRLNQSKELGASLLVGQQLEGHGGSPLQREEQD